MRRRRPGGPTVVIKRVEFVDVSDSHPALLVAARKLVELVKRLRGRGTGNAKKFRPVDGGRCAKDCEQRPDGEVAAGILPSNAPEMACRFRVQPDQFPNRDLKDANRRRSYVRGDA
jgi:hypothetical protein